MRIALAVLLVASTGWAQMPAEPDVPGLLLNGARKAYNDRNYVFSALGFREFLTRFPQHKDLLHARYGLALALLHDVKPDFTEAENQLKPVTASAEFPDRPFAIYFLGRAQRGLALAAAEQAGKTPQQSDSLRNKAVAKFDEAGVQFATALGMFEARAKAPPAANVNELPADWEWSARSRCDQSECLLRAGKTQAAQAAVAVFVQHAFLTKSKYRALGLYYHGYSSFVLKDMPAAGGSLKHLAPFADPAFGLHARYLMGRVHHQIGELPEAAAHYEAVLAESDKQRKALGAAAAQTPIPDHVGRSAFHLAVVRFEQNNVADALVRFTQFPTQYPGSPLIPEAQLRQGICQWHTRQYPAAITTLTPLVNAAPVLADQALLWIGRSQVSNADPANAAAYAQALAGAVQTFQQAAAKAAAAAANDPESKARLGEVRFQWAEAHMLAKQFKEAAAVYQAAYEDPKHERAEEAMQRQATALHLATMYAESDAQCAKFAQAFPKSTLLPSVLFRSAENAFFTALAAANNPKLPNRDAELGKLFGEAAKRYQAIVEKYPELPSLQVARYGLGVSRYRIGLYADADVALGAIPNAALTGDLSAVPFLRGECRMRLPVPPGDAAAVQRTIQANLTAAVAFFEQYLAAQPAGENAPDCLLRQGIARLQLADLAPNADERTKTLAAARAGLDKFVAAAPWANHALFPQAVFERAKVMLAAGDAAGASAEFAKFNAAPLNASQPAALALLRLSLLQRIAARAADAAALLAAVRPKYEPDLLKDPQRADWVPLLGFHHGAALQEAGKPAEARPQFEAYLKSFPNHADAPEAVVRIAQCLMTEAAVAGVKPEDALKTRQAAAARLEALVNELKAKQPKSEHLLRALYEWAWTLRPIGEAELADNKKKLIDEAVKKDPKTAPTDIAVSALPIPPSHTRMSTAYTDLVTAGPDHALAQNARFELAEFHSLRLRWDDALALLNAALAKPMPADLAERVRLRAGICLAAKGDFAGAVVHFEEVIKNPKSPLLAQAAYRSGDAHLQAKAWQKAADRLAIFNEGQPLAAAPDIADRGLFRLGEAQAQLGKWAESRAAFEQLLRRFPQSTLIHEARHLQGWAMQNQKQYDPAVAAYLQVLKDKPLSETAAKSQFRIGTCRMDQQRWSEAAVALMAVVYNYESATEWVSAALFEAGRAHLQMQEKDKAVERFTKLVREHPKSAQAEPAKAELKKLGVNI